MVLINGADGIGTGWSTSVPNYNPREVVDNLKRMMEGEEPETMTPWYRGFTGTIVPTDARNSSFTTFGTVGKLDATTLHISELPVKKWTQDYKDSTLEPLLGGAAAGDDKKGAPPPELLSDVREHHTDTTVSFSIRFKDAAALEQLEAKNEVHKQLKLSSSLSTTNMTLFDERGRIVKHEAPEDILSNFYALRLSFYEKRKMHLSEVLTEQWSKLDNRMRFVLAVVSGELKIANVKKAVLVETLKKHGYATFEPAAKKKKAGDDDADDADEEAVDVDASEGGSKAAAQAAARGYDYLLSMPLWSLTLEKVESLKAELLTKEAELQKLLATSTKQLWTADLDAFLEGYSQWEAELVAAEAGAPKPKASGKGKAPPPKKAAAKKKAHDSDDLSDDDDDDFMSEGDDSDYDEKKKKKPAKKAPKAKEEAPMLPLPSAASIVPIAPPAVVLGAGPKRKAPNGGVGGSRPGSSLASEGPSRPVSRAGSDMPASIAEDDEAVGASPVAKPVAKRACAKESPVGGLGALAALLGGGPVPECSAFDDVDASMDEAEPEEVKEAVKPKKAPAAKPPPAAKKAAPAAKKPPAPKKRKDESDDDDDALSDDGSEAEVAPAPRPSARPGRAAAAKATAKYADMSDDDDEASDASEEEEESEEEKPKPKAKAPPKPKAAAAPPKALPKKVLRDESDDDDDFDESEEEKPKPKAKAAPKPKAAAAPAKAPAAKKAPAPKKPPAPKKKKDESDDDDFSDDGSEAEVAPAPRPSARPGRAAAAKATAKYADMSDDEDDDDDFSDDGSD